MANCKNCGHEIEHFVDGGGVPQPEQSNAPEAPAQAPVVVNVGTPAPPAPVAPVAPVAPTAVPLAPAAEVKPALVPPAGTAPQGDPNQSTGYKVPQNVQDAINAPSPMQMMQQAQAEHIAQHKQDLVEDDQKFNQDLVNGHITPKTYQDLYAHKETLGKIGTIFGLLIGGAGSGLAHQQNALLNAWDKQISNDLEAQKQSKANAQNFLHINQADLANKVGAMGGVETARALALETSRKQMLQASFHSVVEKIKTLPASQQGKAIAALQAMMPAYDGRIDNINDAMAGAAAKLGMRNPLDQAQSPQGGKPSGKAPQSPQSGQSKGVKSSKPDDSKDHILKPGASNSFSTAQYNPAYNDDKGEAQSQLQKASQADKAIDMINKHFPQMLANVRNVSHPSGSYQPLGAGLSGNATVNAAKWLGDKASDASGFIHQKAEGLSGIPYVGEAISGLGKTLTPTEKNKDYDIHRDAVATAMANVLTTSGLTPTEAQSVINDFMPVMGDSDQMARNKLKTAIEKMKAAVTTTAIDRHHLTRNPQK